MGRKWIVNTQRTEEPDRKARRVAGANTLAADPVEKPYLKRLHPGKRSLPEAAELDHTGRRPGRQPARHWGDS